MIATLAMLTVIILWVLIVATMHAQPQTPFNPSKPFKTQGNALSDPFTQTLNTTRLLWAIAEVENTPNHVIGAAGERSRYQIKYIVWRAHSSQPFAIASINTLSARQEVNRVARAHLSTITRALTQAGEPVSPYNLALCWTSGVSAALKGRATATKRDYAERVDALYHSTHPHA